MITYRISYNEQRDGIMQSVDVLIRAMGYADKGDTLTLFDILSNGEVIHIASFKNWNSITEIEAVQE